ncbi:MAG: diguanylate cyclase [Ruminococcus sp.]|jgi:diguanylate cyclase (GGDEF)-like protein|nr:diguanylate cyclase [Ruminococcus sp.]
MSIYHILVYLSLFGSVIISLLVINHREIEQNRCISNATLLLAVYILGYSFEITAKSFEASFIGLILEYIGYPFISPLIFLYALSHIGIKVPKPVKPLLFIIPMLQSVLAITSPYHTLYYTKMEFTETPILSHMYIEGSPIYYICFIYIYIMLVTSAIILTKNAFAQKGSKRYTEFAIAIAFFIPIITTSFYLAGLTPWSYDITPVFLFTTCLIICICTLRFNYLQFLPAATSQLVDEMKDAFVVLDADNCFVNANIAAKKLFPFLKTAKFGSEIPDDEREYFNTESNEFEFSVNKNDRDFFYKASVGVIEKRSKPVCKTFIFYDITSTKKLITELDQKTSYDEVTGIYNRVTLMRYLYIIQEKTDIEYVTSAILMVDIDDFKRVNETFGYQGGDKTLSDVSSLIKTCIRENDIFGRYDDEEFCIALWNTDRNAAEEKAEKIRDVIEKAALTVDGISFSVTVSIGISLYIPDEEKKIEAVLAEAGEALNAAKEDGKNNCKIYQK